MKEKEIIDFLENIKSQIDSQIKKLNELNSENIMNKIDRKIFFNEYKNKLDPNKSLDSKEISAIDDFIDFVDMSSKELTLNQWAYVFATTFHETSYTFLPVREAFWLSETWRKKNLRYYPYYGRGFVQITWDFNYKHYSKILNEDLLKNPDLAMIPKYAFRIMIDGFKKGVFTGKKITDYINSDKTDYKGARKCINGTDKDDTIATYARLFESILKKCTVK